MNSTTADIVAENNPFKAEIMRTGEKAWDALNNQLETALKDFWALHERVTKEKFQTVHEQAEALEKLGRLAVALKALDDAREAMNKVRCF